jgi:hypothetical protein
VKLARLRRPKAACSPSNADYRPKTNAAILWTWVTLKGDCAWRDRIRE